MQKIVLILNAIRGLTKVFMINCLPVKITFGSRGGNCKKSLIWEAGSYHFFGSAKYCSGVNPVKDLKSLMKCAWSK